MHVPSSERSRLDLDRISRSIRRMIQQRSIPARTSDYARWWVSSRLPLSKAPKPCPTPVLDYLAAAAVALLQACEQSGIRAFLISDQPPAIIIGIAGATRRRFGACAAKALPGWKQQHAANEMTVAPAASGTGSTGITVTLWEQGDRPTHLVRRGSGGKDHFSHAHGFPAATLRGTRVVASPLFVRETDRHAVRFPIDAVVTWIDQTDESWRSRKDGAFERNVVVAPPNASDARFRSSDELRYLLRSIESFAPFIRHIYVVTDCRPPAWLDLATAGITFVDQTALLGGLPVFNSLAVETALHRIEDLSEHFIYFNDDMFLARPVAPEKFFSPTGALRLTEGPAIKPGQPDPNDSAFETSAQVARDLIHATYGWLPERGVNHVPLPQSRSLCAKAETLFKSSVDATRRSTFRNVTNAATATGLYLYVGAQLGQVEPSTLQWDYVNTADALAQSRYHRLLRANTSDTFCCNDEGSLPQTNDLTSFLNSYFPTPSRFERY